MHTNGQVFPHEQDRQVTSSPPSTVLGSFRGSVDWTPRPNSPSAHTVVAVQSDQTVVRTVSGDVTIGPALSGLIYARTVELTREEICHRIIDRLNTLLTEYLQILEGEPINFIEISTLATLAVNNTMSSNPEGTLCKSLVTSILEIALLDAKSRHEAAKLYFKSCENEFNVQEELKALIDQAAEKRDQKLQALKASITVRQTILNIQASALITNNQAIVLLTNTQITTQDALIAEATTKYVQAEKAYNEAALSYDAQDHAQTQENHDNAMMRSVQSELIVDAIQSALESHKRDDALSNQANGELLTAVSAFVSQPRQDFTNPAST